VHETGREVIGVSKIYWLLLQFFEVPVKSLKSPVGVTSSSASSNAKTQQTTVTAQNTTVIQVSLALFGTYVPLIYLYFKLLKACIRIHERTWENTPRNSVYIFRQQGNLLDY
jgi:hypothetical protein